LVFHLGQPVHKLRSAQGGQGAPILRRNVSRRVEQVRPVTDQTSHRVIRNANLGRYARYRHTGRVHAGNRFLFLLGQVEAG
jgi:hypothetical protein